ncbi:LysE family translocator [Paracoccus jiaweipingae]|uniref:LysE family translocator n=1 Tax=unclassified Paracoccus (in: a-proteobacteria) TaxID=2688777 RepID=UPI0037BB19E0
MIALLIFLIPLAYSPGPGNLTFAANGARFGVTGLIPALAGYSLATLAVTVLLAQASGAALTGLPGSAGLIQIAGALWVLRIAWGFWTAGAAGAAPARAIGFCDGVLLLLLNPKAWAIIALMLTQFSSRLSPVTISVIFTLNNLVAFLIRASAGHALLRSF